MADPENPKYDILSDAQSIVEGVEATQLYPVSLERTFLEIVKPPLYVTLGVLPDTPLDSEAIDKESDKVAFSIVEKFYSVEPSEDQDSVSVDLTLSEMDYLNSLIEDSAGILRRDVSKSDMTPEDKEFWMRTQPEAYASLLKTLRVVNKAFQESGAPPRPLYTKYFG